MTYKMTYIILGASGYIGSAFVRELQKRELRFIAMSRHQKLAPLSRVGVSEHIDYTSREKFCNYLDINSTGNSFVVVNCAGYVGRPNVDAVEENKDEAIKANVALPLMLSNECRRRGVPFAHISSGCIYDGYSKEFTEEDEPTLSLNNGSFYSGSKALGEHVVRDNTLAWIFRLRMPFNGSPSPRNYLTKLLTYPRLLNAVNSLTHTGDFVRYALELMEKAPYGIYNVTNPEGITAKEVLDQWGLDREFHYYESYEQFAETIATPRSNCVLDTSKMERYIECRTSKEAIASSIKEYPCDKALDIPINER